MRALPTAVASSAVTPKEVAARPTCVMKYLESMISIRPWRRITRSATTYSTSALLKPIYLCTLYMEVDPVYGMLALLN